MGYIVVWRPEYNFDMHADNIIPSLTFRSKLIHCTRLFEARNNFPTDLVLIFINTSRVNVWNVTSIVTTSIDQPHAKIT